MIFYEFGLNGRLKPYPTANRFELNKKGDEMKKAVITILGLAGGNIVKDNDSKLKAINYKSKHNYYFDEKNSLPMYSNTLPLLIDKYANRYEIIPLFTKEAKLVQSKILSENENEKELSIFNDKYLIKDENDFESLLALITQTMDNYDRIIIDITHGFRHMPILVTINLIMENIKDIQKVEHIWFAKEIVKAGKDIVGKYHLIDLKNYLDLASLSFIIKNFKDNYTIASSIKISGTRYKELITHLNQFSKDIMALSVNNLFYNTYPALDKVLSEMKDDDLLKKDLNELQEALKIFEYHEHKRYKLYFTLAEELKEKGYLLQSVALIAEAKGYYVKSSMKSTSYRVRDYFEEIEKKIEEGVESKKYNYYILNQECKKIYSATKNDLLIPKVRADGKKTKPMYKNFKLMKDKSIIEEIKDFIGYKDSFKDFMWHDLRNQLVHANSIENIDNAKKEIDDEINKFDSYCIEQNILNCSK